MIFSRWLCSFLGVVYLASAAISDPLPIAAMISLMDQSQTHLASKRIRLTAWSAPKVAMWGGPVYRASAWKFHLSGRSLGAFPPRWQPAVDFDLERKAQERAYHDDQSENRKPFEGRRHADHADDVRSDQKFGTKQDPAPEPD